MTSFSQIFYGGSGNCHVYGNPNDIGFIAEQDSTSDCLVVYDMQEKVLYTYHQDSTEGNRWQPFMTEEIIITQEIFEVSTTANSVTLEASPNTIKQVIRQGIEVKNYTYENGEVVFPIRFYPPETIQIFYE